MYINELRTGKDNDRRLKLTDEDRQEIRQHHKNSMPIRQIVRLFPQVCRRTIQFVLFPERLKASNYPGHWVKYYDKDKWRVTQAEHRAYKKELKNKGLIKGV
jgi:IS30 family transposase